MDMQKVKQIIGEKEENAWNCNGKLCDYSVKIINLKERKQYFVADVIVTEQGGDRQRFNKCEYNKQIFKLI